MTQRLLDLRTKPKPPWVYVGRPVFFRPTDDGKCVRLPGSPLANPRPISKVAMALQSSAHGRQRVIDRNLEQYELELREKIAAGDKRILALLREITETTALACWCTTLEGEAIYTGPLVCHGQIVFRAWRWLKQAGRI